MSYRLALDLGTNSIGWAQYALDSKGQVQTLLDGGVHIFDQGRDPKALTSNAADRRVARGLRRNRDRKLRRKGDLIATLCAHGLMPEDKKERKALETLDPYGLRQAGLKTKLTAPEFGRALFHLQQRRGFKSNRKSDGGEDGKIRQASAKLGQQLLRYGHETYGAFLADRRSKKMPTRLRLQGIGANAAYEFYPTRDLIKAEFDLLFARQRSLGLTEANEQAQHAIERVFFRQRNLRPPLVGRCAFLSTLDRASKAMPTSQRFRIWSDVLNLRVRDTRQNERPLSEEEQDTSVQALLKTEKLTFASLKIKLKLGPDATFNLESDRRKFLKGDETAARFRRALKSVSQTDWDSLSLDAQNQITALIIGHLEDDVICATLQNKFGFCEAGAQALAAQNPTPARGHLSLEAMGRILEIYHTKRLPYDQATQAAGLGHHSDHRTGEVWDTLPYYGEVLSSAVSPTVDPEKAKNEADRFGRFPNPTVHIALNRLRKLVNALIARDGKPDEIVIESGRELPLSAEGRKDLNKRQTQNTKENDRRAEELKTMDQRVSADTLLRLSLWEELGPDHLCVFSGERITRSDLFDGRAEIEHILPYSRTLDDSRTNKTLAVRRINREKGNRSPFEAFGDNSAHDYDEILMRVKSSHMAPNKARRFAQNAMEKYEDEGNWLQRQLTDTQYVSRLAVAYLTPICASYTGRNIPVWSGPGGLTAKIRYSLGLNKILGKKGKKNRDDHRHHFVDACVLGVVDRGFLQQIGKLARRSEDNEQQNDALADFITAALGPIAAPLRTAIEQRARTMTIAHRPDHSKGGQLLKETAYGFADKQNPALTFDKKQRHEPNVTLRVPLDGDKFKTIEDLRKILSAKTAKRIYDLVYPEVEAGVEFKEAMANAIAKTGMRKARIGLRETVEPVVVAGALTKGYANGGNWAYDFFECPHHGFGAELINLRTANAGKFTPPWKDKGRHPEARLLMRLFNGDLIEIDDPRPGKQGRTVFRIQKMTAGKITLCEPMEANAADRNKAEQLMFDKGPSPLMKLGIRKLHVSVLGEVSGKAPKS